MKILKLLPILLLAACASKNSLTGETGQPKQEPSQNSPTGGPQWSCTYFTDQTQYICPPWTHSQSDCYLNIKHLYQCEDSNGQQCLAIVKWTGEPDYTTCQDFDWRVLK